MHSEHTYRQPLQAFGLMGKAGGSCCESVLPILACNSKSALQRKHFVWFCYQAWMWTVGAVRRAAACGKRGFDQTLGDEICIDMAYCSWRPCVMIPCHLQLAPFLQAFCVCMWAAQSLQARLLTGLFEPGDCWQYFSSNPFQCARNLRPTRV